MRRRSRRRAEGSDAPAASERASRLSHLRPLKKGVREAGRRLSGGAPGDAGTAGVWLPSEGREGEAPELREEKIGFTTERCLAGNRVGTGGTSWARPRRQDWYSDRFLPSRYLGKSSSPPRHWLLTAGGPLGARPAPSAQAEGLRGLPRARGAPCPHSLSTRTLGAAPSRGFFSLEGKQELSSGHGWSSERILSEWWYLCSFQTR